MTLTDIIAKITLFAKRAIVNDNSSNPAVSVVQSGTGDAARFQGGNALNGTVKIFDQSGTGGDFVYDGGSDGIFTFKNNGTATSFLNGNVGIDTLTPGQKLDVNGGIRTNNTVFLNNTAATNRFVSYQTNQLTRWHIGADNAAESGGNTGSDFFIHNFDDAGIFISRPLHITRSTGNVGIGTNNPVNKLQVVGSFGRGTPVTKTGDFTLADTENWIIVNKGSSCTVTLPAASSWLGREFTIKVITAHTVVSASSNVVPANSATPGTAILSASAGAWATLVSDGTNWVIMAKS